MITQIKLPLTRSLMNMLRSRHTDALTKSFLLNIERGTPSGLLKRQTTQNFSEGGGGALRRMPTGFSRESSARVHFQDSP